MADGQGCGNIKRRHLDIVLGMTERLIKGTHPGNNAKRRIDALLIRRQ